MPITERRHAQLDPSGRVPTRQLGHITLSGHTYPLIDCGAWSAASTYQAGNLVTSGATTYVALPVTGNVGHAPPNATYWQTFTASTLYLRSDRVFAVPDGIKFDVANVGGTLSVETSGNTTFISDSGVITLETSAGDLFLVSNGGDLKLQAVGTIGAAGAGLSVQTQGTIRLHANFGGTDGSIVLDSSAGGTGGDITLVFGGARTCQITGGTLAVNTSFLGFYNVTPVTKPAHPVTLADVIAILTNVGLCS